MGICQNGDCQKEATTKGFVLGLDRETNKSEIVEVNACDEHKKVQGFFAYEDEHQ